MSNERPHYFKIVRDAAAPLDSFIHRLTSEGQAFALLRTSFKINTDNIQITPDPKDRDVVFDIATEEFSKAGWGFGSQSTPFSEDPKMPTVAMTFRHPLTNTRMGKDAPPQGQSISYNIATPPVGIEMTPEVVEWYAKQAADITRSILAQRAVDETGGIPGRPAAITPVKVAATPMHTAPLFAQQENEDD